MIEIIPDKITVADRIRSMDDDELNNFLFRFKINAIGLFIKNGCENLCDAQQQLLLLQADEDKADLRNSEFANTLLWGPLPDAPEEGRDDDHIDEDIRAADMAADDMQDNDDIPFC